MITNPNPIVVPAQASVTADAIWIRSLTVTAPTVTGKVSVTAQVVPYVSSTGAMLYAQSKTLTIPDVFTEAGTDATLATAMTAIFAAVQSQVTKKNLFPHS